jgi:hypothetical protein
MDDEDVFGIFSFSGGLGNMNMSSWTRNFQLPWDTVSDRLVHSQTSFYGAQLDPWDMDEGAVRPWAP